MRSEKLELVLKEVLAVALCVVPQVWGFYLFTRLFYL